MSRLSHSAAAFQDAGIRSMQKRQELIESCHTARPVADTGAPCADYRRVLERIRERADPKTSGAGFARDNRDEDTGMTSSDPRCMRTR